MRPSSRVAALALVVPGALASCDGKPAGDSREPSRSMEKVLWLMALALGLTGLRAFAGPPEDLLLFDFEEAADLKAWTNLELPDARVKEPAAGIDRSTDMATSGKHSLKITFGGGTWPTLTTTSVPPDWDAWHTLKADVTVGRPCVVGFTVLQERSRRGEGYEEAVSRWTRTAFLQAGKNRVSAALRPASGNALDPRRGKVVRFEIFTYNPHPGEAISIDNIRLSKAKEEQAPAKMSFAVAGTDWELDGVNATGVLSAGAVMELGKKLKAGWNQTRGPDGRPGRGGVRGTIW